MKKILFIPLLSALLFCACVKKGDFSELKHPISLQGTYDPELGFPFLSLNTDMGTLLSMTSPSFGKFSMYINTDSNRLSLRYHDTMDYAFDISKFFSQDRSKRYHNHSKGITFDSIHPGSLLLDKYWEVDNEMSFGSDLTESLGDVEFQNMYMNVNLFVKSKANNYTLNLINRGFGVYMKDLKCKLVYSGGKVEEVPMSGVDDSISINTFNQGINIRLFEGTDMSQVLSSDLESMKFSAHLNVYVEDSAQVIQTTSQILDPLSGGTTYFYPDSCGIDSIVTTITMDADFVLQFYATSFDISDTNELDLTNLDSMLSKVEKYLKINDSSSFLTFKATNSIPMAFSLDVRGMDANKQALQSDNIIQGDNIIKGAPLKKIETGSEKGSYKSDGTSETRFSVAFNQKLLDDMRKTKFMRLGLKLATSTTGNPEAKPKVVVNGTDKLTLNAYITLSAQLNLDIPITK